MFFIIIVIIAIIIINHAVKEQKYKQLEAEILKELGYSNWNIVPFIDAYITVKSRQSLEKYNDIKFFKDNKEKVEQAETIIKKKSNVASTLSRFLDDNNYKSRFLYNRIERQIKTVINNAEAYRISVSYISSAGNNLGTNIIAVKQYGIDRLKNDPSLLMTKGEYNKYLRGQQKEALGQKQHDYYECVNSIIDYANKNKDTFIIKGSQDKLDDLIIKLFDRTVNSIKKIKELDSEEWNIIGDYITQTEGSVKEIVNKNQRILNYYQSTDFFKIKETCKSLMDSQKDFNEYINEKVQSISKLFGTRIIRNDTINNDEYNYIRSYKKTITPFTAEVSAAVFASAENNPLEYIVKYFYPNKKSYSEQIQKLCKLVEELETLRDAKQIIENYKAEYKQYLGSVPNYVMKDDKNGFYSRLGFADIDESTLTVEYKFTYTSGGGMAQRSFTVPMTEETIAELVKTLESKLTASAFAVWRHIVVGANRTVFSPDSPTRLCRAGT